MEEIQFNKLYKIDKERLRTNFQRIQNLNKDLNLEEIIAKFLDNQSIGIQKDQILEIIKYFQNRLSNDKELLDFAFEWIRANKIRLEYKKYITLNDYKSYTTALDDAIFLFFLKYDKFLRAFFQSDMEEYEFCTLYQIIFNLKQSESFSFSALLEENKNKGLSIIILGEKFDMTIHTLREGLSDMIKNDYNEGRPSEVKIINYGKKVTTENAIDRDFDGTMVERLIKFYCFQRRNIDKKELTIAINQFLSSYFQFSLFYDFSKFREKLVSSFIDYIYSGLTENYKNQSIESLNDEFSLTLDEFEKNLQQSTLNGKAWIEDLRPILQKFIEKFVSGL
ncbi:MAG: hypothetical protein ACFFDY_09310 [Candidatus Thorarchaeota archaeon]